MKGYNQVACANLPHPVRLTCQNASLMTQGFVCLRKRTMREKNNQFDAQEKLYLTTTHTYLGFGIYQCIQLV